MTNKKITTQVLTPALWSDVEALFGKNGACGGCWCMFWRIEKGEKWDDIKGPKAKARLKKGIANGTVKGVLAYADGDPVGWCSYGERVSFPKLDRAPSLKCGDAAEVASVPCFYVKAGWREKGVGRALLAASLKALKKEGAKTIEGYPVKLPESGRLVPAFAHTGTESMFAAAGFKPEGPRGGKQRMRLVVGAGKNF
jgi:GNAT superfamily N-acetyltransferase